MIFAVLTCISLVALGCGWLVYLRSRELFFCILIAVASEFFFIPPQVIGFKYLLLPILFVLLFEGAINGRLALGRYGWWVFWFTGISIFSLVVATFSGQSFLLGIKAAKFIPLVTVYFLIAGQEFDVQKFTKYFILMALAVAFLATVTSFTHGAVNFFYGLPAERITEQAGRLRITAGQYVVSAAAVVAFARFNRSWSIGYLLAFFALFAEVILVQQTRGFIFAIFLCLPVIYFFSHRLTPIRLSLSIIGLGLFLTCFLVFSGSDLARISFIKRVQTDLGKKGGSYGGSLQARLNTYEYYWKQIENSPFTGRGLLNFNWDGNPDKKLQKDYSMHLSDVGILTFLVQAGVIGIVWLLYGLSVLWKDILLYRNLLAASSYFIIATFTMPTLDMFLRNDSMFLFAVFLGLTSTTISAAKANANRESEN